MMKALRYSAVIASLALLVVACAPKTRIATNKASGYDGELKRIFVVTDIGSEFGREFSDAFQNRFTSIAQSCGAEMRISRISTLELDDDVHLKRMRAFNPDTMLSIRRNGGTRNQYGVFHVIYDVRLIDVPTNKTVWRANVNFYRGGSAIPIADRGQALATDIATKMRDDNLFRCEIPK